MKKKLSILFAFAMLLGIFANFNVMADSYPLSEKELDIKWLSDYQDVEYVGEGVFRVFTEDIPDGLSQEDKYTAERMQTYKKVGYIDLNGKVIIPIEKENLLYENYLYHNFSEGLLCHGGKYYDNKGNLVLNLKEKYEKDPNHGENSVFYEDFRDGIALVAEDNSKMYTALAYYDKNGNEIFGITNSDNNTERLRWGSDFIDGKAVINMFNNEKVYSIYINTKGEKILTVDDEARPFSEGLASVRKISEDGDKVAFINEQGKIVIPFEYDYAKDFKEGFAAVCKDEKWGFIDKTGKVVVPIIYDEVFDFNEGRAVVSNRNGSMALSDFSHGYVNTEGKVVVPLKYQAASQFNSGIAAVSENYYPESNDPIKDAKFKISFIDKNGKEIGKCAEPYSNRIEYGSNGIERKLSEGLIYANNGFINKDAKEIIKAETFDYSENVNFNDGIIIVKKDGKWGILKNPLLNKPSDKGNSDVNNNADFLNDKPAKWAEKEIKEAIEQGLIPENLQKEYTRPITREEFCVLVIQMIEVRYDKNIKDIISDESLTIAPDTTFTDCQNPDVLAAKTLGITEGMDKNTFAPHVILNREQAAKFLSATARACGKDIKAEAPSYNDLNKISAWANPYVGYVYNIEVMKGDDNNNFMPKKSYERQQAFVTMLRIWKA